jgi:hypothetical protein
MRAIKILFLAIFLLLSCNKQRLEISQIDFSADGCFGECPIFKMTISGNGNATYNAKNFNKLNGEFETVIQEADLDSLNLLINDADFFSLDSSYTEMLTDQSSYSISIRLKNGQSKTINDYGPSGPKKLNLIYQKIFSLRDSQKWE